MTDGYAFRARIDAPYTQALARVKEALKAEGFGVLTEVDVQSTFAEKLGVEFRAYAILGPATHPCPIGRCRGSWTPASSSRATSWCTRMEWGTDVVIADPEVIVQSLGKPRLESIAREARDKLERVSAALRD